MKPTEIIKDKSADFNGYSSTIRLYGDYADKDCVIAYRKGFLGTAMLVKGKREIFGFLIFNKYSSRWSRPELNRKTLREIKHIFEEDGNEKLVIVDTEEYKVFERKVLFKGLEDE